jgi:hypothetical protein
MAGGALQSLLMHPSVVPFEQRFVRNPLPGIYTAATNRAFTFEIGAMVVPMGMALAISDWKFRVYRFSGVVANETELIHVGQSTLNIGVDFNIDQVRKGNVMYELLPINPTAVQAAFSPAQTGGTITSSNSLNPVPATQLLNQVYQGGLIPGIGSTNQQDAFVQGSGIGSALMPITDQDHQGPRRMPFTYYARENQRAQMRISVFNALGYPVAYFEAKVSGYLIPINTLDATLKAMSPCLPGRG